MLVLEAQWVDRVGIIDRVEVVDRVAVAFRRGVGVVQVGRNLGDAITLRLLDGRQMIMEPD
jgi:hypothetical protein